MNEKIKIKIDGICSLNDKVSIETEIDVLKGVKNIDVDEKINEILVEFDNSLISENEISELIEKLGYKIEKEVEIKQVVREHRYYVKGMHCASCEILIEKELLNLENIKSVESNAGKGEVLVEFIGEKPEIEKLNSLFKKDDYLFSDKKLEEKNDFNRAGFLKIFVVSFLLIGGFLYLNKLGLSDWINVNSKSSLVAFFGLGLIAGMSSCAALVGGLILSMSKQWTDLYSKNHSVFQKFQPHLMFNFGRIISYGALGTILGIIGGKLQISLGFAAILVIVVSVIMIFLGLQMLGFKKFCKFQFGLPKFITRYAANETNFKGRYMPFLMGAMTFFLPCGFTITAQGLALISGSPIQAGLIMLFFALGTTPALLSIGFSSVALSRRPHLAYQFSRVAGILILFFALFNINNQMNVLGFSSFSDITKSSQQKNNSIETEKGLAPIANGKQILKMEASSSGYNPNFFKVKVGTPVRWEITDVGTSGCTNAVISKNLFSGEIRLTPGETSVKEFTPEKPGKYKFSCWMGMVSGIIEVVDGKTAIKNSDFNNQAANAADNNVIPSGAKGCGCGGGSGKSCGGN